MTIGHWSLTKFTLYSFPNHRFKNYNDADSDICSFRPKSKQYQACKSKNSPRRTVCSDPNCIKYQKCCTRENARKFRSDAERIYNYGGRGRYP